LNIVVHRSLPLTWLRRLLAWEPARYLAASLVALAIDVGTFSMAMRLLHAGWAFAAFAGFVAGAVVAYWASVRWVFKERSRRSQPFRELATFVLGGAVGMLVTQSVLWVTIGRMHLQPELSRLAAAGVTFAFNYATRAALLFRERNNSIRYA